MAKFKLPVEWVMCGFVEIEADSLEDAIDKFWEQADEISLPKDSRYVDASFRLTTEDTEELELYQDYDVDSQELWFFEYNEVGEIINKVRYSVPKKWLKEQLNMDDGKELSDICNNTVNADILLKALKEKKIVQIKRYPV